MVKTREGGRSGLALFAAELQAARAKAGMSQEDLAARLSYSPSQVAMVEGMRRAPVLQFAQKCDEVFDAPGTFVRLQMHARATPLPSWFRPYAEIEATATQLRSWQPMVMDGLLQTEDYARAILAVQPNTTEDELEEMVAARMARQVILDRAQPPLLWVLLDEAVMIRQVGSAKIMHEQLLHLTDMSHRPNITIQVVPLSAGAHSGLLGAFAVAEAAGVARAAYLETPTQGFIVETPATVDEIMLTFDTLRSEALPHGASSDLIAKRVEDCEPDQS